MVHAMCIGIQSVHDTKVVLAVCALVTMWLRVLKVCALQIMYNTRTIYLVKEQCFDSPETGAAKTAAHTYTIIRPTVVDIVRID